MNKKTISLLAAAILVAAAVAHYFNASADKKSGNTTAINTGTPKQDASNSIDDTSIESDEFLSNIDLGAANSNDLDELNAALALATKERERAEQDLQSIESKVREVESQVESLDIEVDDLNDGPDEITSSFEAIFNDYQRAVMAYETASIKEEVIQEKIAAIAAE